MLGNGLPLHIVDSEIDDLVRIDIVFDAGSRYHENPLIPSFTGRMLREGTAKYTSRQIAEAIDFYGAYLETATDRDHSVVSLYCMTKYLHKLLPVLREIISRPVFPARQVSTELEKQKQEYIIGREKVSFIARLRFAELLFGKHHPYGRALNLEDFGGIRQSVLADFYESNIRNGSRYIMVSGNSSDIVTDLITNEIDNCIPAGSVVSSFNNSKENSQLQGDHIIHHDNALQSALRIGRPMFGRQHPDYAEFQVLNVILGGYFGSRLMKNIREDKGYTYGIGSAIIPFATGGMFVISAEVGAEVTRDAVSEIMKEIEHLVESDISEDELAVVRNFMRGTVMRSFDGPFAKADRLRGLLNANLDESYYFDLVRAIDETRAYRLKELAQHYLNPDNLTCLLVGNGSIIAKGAGVTNEN
jgi:predicted Zn-dependent peptidase